MRLLGSKSPLSTFRWDLIYLYAGLNAEEERPEVRDLAPAVLDVLQQLQTERAAFEEAENLLVVALALRARRDRKVDKKTLELGGVARATDKEVYALLFPNANPSQVTKMALDRQLKENKRIADELGALPDGHPLRAQYEVGLKEDIDALEKADAAVDTAEVSLSLARSKLRQLKLHIDKRRLDVHAKLLQILGDKKAADSFFRPSTTAPGEAAEAGEEAAPAEGAEG
ncbi:hypothetical protein [Polyangium sp. 15x6]|uniref:hypothetical protein n=1 Tax=Polyangium sp. 15x6 TaxID=3042687 RepID=UPI00249C8DB5|nr:hypothetical protein [Polyangium sp. 15x6]MDI3286907.1 hypothetical protein [Polyangium sp. 15x6]